MKSTLQETIVALATPPGSGAIGVIRVSGSDAIEVVQTVFEGKNLRLQKGYSVHFGRICREDGTVVDEVLVNLFRAPRSYTGEDTVEISCHGSMYILQEVIQLLINACARPAEPGEFTLRAFLNGKLDLTQAEAVADLIASSNEKAHALAMQQLRGGFSKKLASLRTDLIHFASLIELELDFSEEDVEFADRKALQALIRELLAHIYPLIESFQYGNAIKEGIQTVLAGRPNAGKSTLLNALLNEERAIVSDIAGTTRDTIEEDLNIQGVRFKLIDTAGIREATDTIEAIGVARTLEKISQSTLLVYLFDITEMSPSEVREELGQLVRDGMDCIVVANKMDLNPYLLPETYYNELIHPDNLIPTAAIHQMNIEYLKTKLLEKGLKGQLHQESVVVSNIRHVTSLQQSADSLERALQSLRTGIPGDLIAMDIRRSLHYLGEITGEISTDDLLDNIFSKFCIGK